MQLFLELIVVVQSSYDQLLTLMKLLTSSAGSYVLSGTEWEGSKVKFDPTPRLWEKRFVRDCPPGM